MSSITHSTWTLNDGISYPAEEIFQGLIFTANGESYSAIQITTESIFYVNDSGNISPVGQTALMTIELADGEQTVSDAFLYWFVWNFTKQEAPPVIALSGNTLRISEVNGATGYNLYVNSSYLMVTSNFEVDLESALSDYGAGDYTVHVTADIDGSESAPSNSVTYTIAEPQPVEDEKYTIKKSTLSGIADAIRSKTGKSYLIDAANFASEIESIQTEEPPALEELTATENGEYTPPIGIDGFSKVTVRVPGEYLSFVNASTGQSRTISGVAISDDAISFVSVSHEVAAAKSN